MNLKRSLLVTLTLALMALPVLAQANPAVLLESYPRARPDDAAKYIEIMVRSLSHHTPLHGDELRKRVEAELSLPPGPIKEPQGIRALVMDGRRQFIEGNYQRAIVKLEQARRILLSSTRVVAADQSLRKSLHRALMFLAHAYLRVKEGQKATDRMGEVIRSFAGQELTLVQYGPELMSFYKKVRLQMRKLNRGALSVATSSKGCLVFVNERFVGMSPVSVPDLYPGRYRVYVQRPREPGRVHVVKLSGGDYKLQVDFGLDSTLITRPWVGFRFDSPGTLKVLESRYAASVGRALDSPSVLVVGIRKHKSVRSLVGTLVSASTGKMVRFATVALEPVVPADEHVSALGQFLVAGKISPILKEVFPPRLVRLQPATVSAAPNAGDRPAATATPQDQDPLDVRSSPLGVVKWVSLGVSLVTLAGGITLLAMDAQPVSCGLPEDVLCPERYVTMTPGAILTAAGGTVAAAAVVLFYLDHRRVSRASATLVAPWISPSGGGVTAVLSF